jgi:hypothetical protein
MTGTSHLIGLPLGTEEDWPTAFEQMPVNRTQPARRPGARWGHPSTRCRSDLVTLRKTSDFS